VVACQIFDKQLVVHQLFHEKIMRERSVELPLQIGLSLQNVIEALADMFARHLP
jgi:hypothetical protein